MRKLLLGLMALALFAGGLGWFYYSVKAVPLSAVAGKVALYQCSMHPQVIQKGPGTCPICHMDLERREFEAHDPVLAKAGLSSLPSAAQAPRKGVLGKAAFTLSPERRQLIGVMSEPARVSSVAQTLRLPGQASGGRGVSAQLLEMDAGKIVPGMQAVLVGPDRSETAARVQGVEPRLDSLTRSFGIMLTAASQPAWLRPGVYVEVRLALRLAQGLTVPLDAVIDTGLRQVVFVDKGDGLFEPREIKTGARGDERVAVLEGVAEGEKVVVKANFLIDSESRFRAAAEQF
jgi:hypothetical protein